MINTAAEYARAAIVDKTAANEIIHTWIWRHNLSSIVSMS